jgi:hypothetical protein
MNLLDQFLNWLRVGSAQPAVRSTQPTIGDRLLVIAADYLKSKTTEAQEKANAANAAAPADNAPGATRQASDAPLGQTLYDLLKANQQ